MYPDFMEPINKLVLDSLHREEDRFPAKQLSGLDAAGWEQLFAIASEHRVVPLLYDRLAAHIPGFGNCVTVANGRTVAEVDSGNKREPENCGPVIPAISKMSEYVHKVAKNNLRSFSELQKYLTRLDQHQIPVIVLKGAWLANKAYRGIGLREMNDIDLLFRAGDLPRAMQIIMDLEYRPDTPVYIEEQIRHNHHLEPFLKKGYGVFELHWNITRPGRYYFMDPEPFWERSQQDVIAGKPACVLSPEDQLLHLCLHTSYQHLFSFGMRPFCDITVAIQHYGDRLDWNDFTARVCACGLEGGVWLALCLACKLTGANVPREVLAEMQPDTRVELERTGLEQIFTKKAMADAVSEPLVALLNKKSLIGKLAVIRSRIFLSQEVMTARYAIKPGSLWIYYYVLIRIWEVVVRHTVKVVRLIWGDRSLAGIAARKQKLRLWLEHPPDRPPADKSV